MSVRALIAPLFLDGDFGKHMVNKVRLTNPAMGNQSNVVLVIETIDYFSDLFKAITEVLRTFEPIGYKQIVYQSHTVTSYSVQHKLRNFLRQNQIIQEKMTFFIFSVEEKARSIIISG